jgi:hypothetical protein
VAWHFLEQPREGLKVKGFGEVGVETFFRGSPHVFGSPKTSQCNCGQIAFARQLS